MTTLYTTDTIYPDLVRHAKSQKRPVETIHRETCRHAKNVVPWEWSRGRAAHEWLDLEWFKPCAFCLPELQNYYPCCGIPGGCGGPCSAFPCWELTT